METLSSILLASLIVSFPLFSLNDALQLRSSPSAASTPRAQPQMLRLLLFPSPIGAYTLGPLSAPV